MHEHIKKLERLDKKNHEGKYDRASPQSSAPLRVLGPETFGTYDRVLMLLQDKIYRKLTNRTGYAMRTTP